MTPMNKKLLKLNKNMLWYQGDELTLNQKRRQSYYALIQDSDSDVVIEEEE